MAKIKKELPTAIRPMFGMSNEPKPMTATEALARQEDKDETIRQLRASLALLEAREADRAAKAKARLAKHRSKADRPKA